jgi:hypothetical protein
MGRNAIVPQSTEKDSISRGVGKKSEIDTLYSQLVHCYIPFLSPPFLPPFPLQLIAQARAWRGYPLPERTQLVAAIQDIDAAKGTPVQNVYRVRGESMAMPGTVIDVGKESASWFTLDDGTIAIRAGWLGTLLVLTETLFRVLRVVELELEQLVPDFLTSQDRPRAPSAAAEERSRAEFVRMWQERKTRESLQWVLAAGKIPLGIGGRPPMIAPQLAGAATVVRLQREGVDEPKASSAAAGLAGVLLNRKVRPEEIRHWRDLFHKVKVPSNADNIPLPQYLSCQLAEDNNLQDRMAVFSPAALLNALVPPNSTCVDLASLIPQIQRERYPEQAEKKEKPSKEKKPAQKEWLFTCRQCNSSEMQKGEIWAHLQNHGIQDEEIDLDLEHKTIYRIGTKEILATLRQIRI